MNKYPHPSIEELSLTGVLSALSDPARLDIVRHLAIATSEATCQSVAPEIPKSTVSHHLKVLREAGVVRSVPRGRERLLTLRREDLDTRWPGLLAAILREAPAMVGGRTG